MRAGERRSDRGTARDMARTAFVGGALCSPLSVRRPPRVVAACGRRRCRPLRRLGMSSADEPRPDEEEKEEEEGEKSDLPPEVRAAIQDHRQRARTLFGRGSDGGDAHRSLWWKTGPQRVVPEGIMEMLDYSGADEEEEEEEDENSAQASPPPSPPPPQHQAD